MSSAQYLREFDPPGFQLDNNSPIGWFDQYFNAFISENTRLMAALEAAWALPGNQTELELIGKLNQSTRNLYVLGKVIFDIENGGIDQALHNQIRLFPYFLDALHDIGAVRSVAVFGELLRAIKTEHTDVWEPIDNWPKVSKNVIENLEKQYYSGPVSSEECLDDELARTIKTFIEDNIEFLQQIRKVQ